MAILNIEDLSLEIAYLEVADKRACYEILLRWRGAPVLNGAILKQRNAGGAKGRTGAIIAFEHEQCGVLPLLKKVLETNQSDYWTPVDPDILLAIYTDADFPFLEPKCTLLWEKPESKAEREALEALREKCGPLPDDVVEVMLLVDAYNFAGANMHYGDGLCFRLRPTRACLRHFYNELPGEYAALCARRGIDLPKCDFLTRPTGPLGMIPAASMRPKGIGPMRTPFAAITRGAFASPVEGVRPCS